MKASTLRARFPGRAGDPERQHHAAVMTTTIARMKRVPRVPKVQEVPRVSVLQNDLPCHDTTGDFSLNRST
jgi:hypothetical protein